MNNDFPKVLYAGWDFAEAMSAGAKAGKPFRLIQFEWRGLHMRIVYDSTGDGRMFSSRAVQIEERLQIPAGKIEALDVYVDER